MERLNSISNRIKRISAKAKVAEQHQPKKTDLARLLPWAGLSFLLSACDQDKAFYLGHTLVFIFCLVLAVKIALIKGKD